MVQELSYGLMERGTQANGGLTKLKVKASSSTRTETTTMATGRRTKLMATAPTSTKMGPSTKGIGKMISSMAMGRSSGLMAASIRENTATARRMERESMFGQTSLNMTACGATI